MVRLRILHISDLHARGDREIERWRRNRVLGQAWEENLEELLQNGAFDVLCFTGDAADWGKDDEFSEAAEFLNGLIERIGLPKERLFVVPGNHDIDRSLREATWRAVREAASKTEPLDLARWLNAGARTLGFESSWREEIFERLGSYRHFVSEHLSRPELVADIGPHAYRQSFDHHGHEIHVVGLDSAWLCGGEDDQGNLRLSDQQVMSQLTNDKGTAHEGFRLVLMHHPLDDLADRDRELVRRCLAEHADLVLRGHLHSTEISTWADPDRQLRQLASGCLYEGHGADQYPNACQVVTVELDDAGRAYQVEVRLRAFSPKSGHWHDDPSLYRDSSDGRVMWTIEPPVPTTGASGPNPFKPNGPALPPAFKGRQAELLRLEASLQEDDGVSIVGDWRIGKSSLLKTWAAKLEGMGRTVRLLDGQGPEGISAQALVAKVLGGPAPESTEAAADALKAWALRQPERLPPVLLIDELDGMVRYIEERFFERLREMLGTLLMVVASRKPVDQLYKEQGRTSPFHNRLRVLQLGLLKAPAAEAVADLGQGELGSKDRDYLLHWAGNHPFHLQLFGHCLVEAHRFGETRAEAIDRYRDNAYPRLRELWRRLDEKERESLKATLQGFPADRRSLKRRGLVTEDGHCFGEILADWLREEV